jgi:hypothetical protein
MIAFVCVQCARPFQAAEALAGKKARCLNCQRKQTVSAEEAMLPLPSDGEDGKTLLQASAASYSEGAALARVSRPLSESATVPPY